MIVLACDRITKSFGVDIILNQITFSVNAGHCVGVVGGNGAGKSTLFKILMGLIPEDQGEIYKAKESSMSYLPQTTVLESNKTIWDELIGVFHHLLDLEKNLRDMEKEMGDYHKIGEAEYSRFLAEYSKLQNAFEEQGGYSYESHMRGVLIGLGFNSDEFHMPISHLSGGQKTRVALAKILLEKPDILLLDEPTNHLDLNAMEWLGEYLSTYSGTIMVISHDRYFLDEICDEILEIENNSSQLFQGNYSQYQQQKSQLIAQREREYSNQQREVGRQEAIIERYRSFNREKSIRAAESRQKRLDKLERVEKVQYLERPKFSFTIDRQSGREVLSINSLSKAFGDNRLLNNISFDLRLGDRVALIGPNGCGKSTLLRIIMGKVPVSSGNVNIGTGVDIGYYDQEMTSLNPKNTVLEELWGSFPNLKETEIRNALAARLFRGDDVYKRVSSLSGGEKGHLLLTKLVLGKENLLILDEPTNHLDMASREELENALEEYPGTILMVSHDRYFLNKIVNRIIVMEEGSTTEYLGNYRDYLEKKKALENLVHTDNTKFSPTQTALKDQRRREREKREKKRKQIENLKDLENQIHRLEEDIRILENQMADPKLYKDIQKMLETRARYDHLKGKLEILYTKWVRMA